MNSPNRRPPHPISHTQLQSPFVPWSLQASLALSAAPPLAHLAPPYPFGLYFQQQNKYYNTSIVNSNYPPPSYPHPQPQHPYPPSWSHPPLKLNPPLTTKHNVSEPSKPKPPVSIICLEEESPPQVIVISDSEELFPLEEKIIPIPPSSRALSTDLTQKAGKEQKINLESPKKRKGRPKLRQKDEKLCINLTQSRGTDRKEEGKDEQQDFKWKVDKTKMIKKRPRGTRFVYRLTPHQKKLMELVDCREYMPGEVMVGPQFQARLPHFRLQHSLPATRTSWLRARRECLLSRIVQ